MVTKIGKWAGVCFLAAAAGACTSAEEGQGQRDEGVEARREALNGATGVFTAEGPGPISNGQVENLTSNPAGFPGPGLIGNQVSGAIQAVVAHPSNANRLVIGAANGGIWTTDNALTNPPTWTARGDQLESLSVAAIAMDRTATDVLVAGFGQISSFSASPAGPFSGLARSTNFGVSWTPIVPVSALTPVGRDIRAVVVRGSMILVADIAGGGVLRSDDNGLNWVRPTGLPITGAHALAEDPSNNLRFYAALGTQGIFRSDDGGQTFVPATGPSACGPADPVDCNLLSQELGLGVSTMRLGIGAQGRLFTIVTRAGQPSYIGFTDDGGATWTPMDIPRQPTSASQTITNATSAIGSPIVVTTAAAHGFSNGDRVRISGVTGNTNANGDFTIAGVTSTTFTLATCLTTAACVTTSNAAYTGGGAAFGYHTSNPDKGKEPGGQGGLHVSIVVAPTNQDIVLIGGDRQDRPLPSFIGADDFSAQIWRGDVTVPRSGTAPGTAPGPSGLIPSPQWEHATADIIAGIPGGGTPGGSAGSAPHADSRCMTFDANGNLIETDDGGIYRRANPLDNTGGWASLNGNLQISEMHDVAFDAVTNTLIGGNQDTGTPFQLTPGGLAWSDRYTADGGDVAVDTHSTPGASVRYFSTQNFGGANRCQYTAAPITETSCSPLALNLRCGASTCVTNTAIACTFSSSTCPGPGCECPAGDTCSAAGTCPNPTPGGTPFPVDAKPTFPFVTRLALNRNDGTNPQRLVFIANEGAYESLNAGDTIFQLRTTAGAPVGAGSRLVAAGHPMNPELLWVGTPMRVRTAAGGGLDQTATQPGGAGVAIALDPSNPADAYVVTTAGVFRTTTTGAVWVNITGDLFDPDQLRAPRNLRTIQFVPGTPAKIYVGADGGVYVSSTASLGFWNRIGTGSLPNALVFDSDYDAASDRLFVSTLGRGAWSMLNASAPNLPPAAVCRNKTVSADASCQGHISVSDVDGGSFDPEGTAVTPVVSSTGPFPLTPPSTVTLTVSDGTSTETCTATVTVQDDTPPVFTSVPPSVTTSICNVNGVITVGQATATDNCAQNLVPSGQVISKNGAPLSPPIPVVGGQVTLEPGIYVIEWSVSDGINPPVTATQTVTVGASIVASNTYQVRDRASVRDAGGNPAAALNSGSGITSIGGDGATVGPILAGGNVTVAWNGYVYGDIRAVGTVQVNDPTKHFGNIVPVSSIVLPSAPTLPAFPAPTGGDQWVNPGTNLSLAPGSYGQIGVNGNPNPNQAAIVRFSAGDYFFTNLYFNSAGLIVVAQPGTRIFVSGNVTFNTSIVTAVGSSTLAPVVLGVSGSGALAMYAPFRGTVIAPGRDLVVGTANGMTYTGSFYARSIDVTPGSALVCDPTVVPQQPSTCANGVLDPGETDVDCGGPQCNACNDGETCSTGSDCVSKVCTAAVCQAPTCTDGQQNGTETAVDCGGVCPACPVACNAFTYQAESMFHSTGNAWWQGGWNIYTNGYIATTHNFTPGPNVITVSALGQEAAGLPHMAVRVGGVLITPTGGYNVTTGGFNPYTFTYNAAGGPQEIRVIFDNDASGWFGDRNLIVRTVAVSCP